MARHRPRTRIAAAWAPWCLAAWVAAAVAGCKPAAEAPADPPGGSTPATNADANSVPTSGQRVEPHDDPAVAALEVRSASAEPIDWFDVLRDGERATGANPPLLNNTVELAPGAYVVDVNRTQRQVTLEAGRKTILWTGDLVVNGEPSHAYWYPMQGQERRLSSNPSLLNSPRALFPGSYRVYVYVSVTTGDQLLGDAEVRPGETTVLTH